jgi:mono/diheme cytochrome c family protein
MEDNVKHTTPRVAVGMALAMSVMLSQVLPAQAQVFNRAQAEAGEKEYDGQCAMCHGAELLGPDAPALVGREVMDNFSTAAGLYEYFSVAMPPQAPGLLSEETYVNIMAYILQRNGAQPGETALDAKPETLASINLTAVTSVAAPAETAANETEAAPSDVPQAYTWGKVLPSILPPKEAEPAAPTVPQAFTWGQTLPSKS